MVDQKSSKVFVKQKSFDSLVSDFLLRGVFFFFFWGVFFFAFFVVVLAVCFFALWCFSLCFFSRSCSLLQSSLVKHPLKSLPLFARTRICLRTLEKKIFPKRPFRKAKNTML